jgi:hypothetical protein
MLRTRRGTLTAEDLQAQIATERQERIDAHKRAVAQRGLTMRAAARADAPLNIFCDGDSWFDYPLFTDTIGWIKADGTPQPEILNLAHYGEATTDLLGVGSRTRIIENLNDPENGKFDAMLFSGGGNDIVGEQFCLWLTQAAAGSSPDYGIDHGRLADILGVVEAAYLDLIQIRNSSNQPDCVLFVHAYDFAQPTGQGVCGFGPWLKPSLDFRGWTDPAAAAAIVKDMLLMLDKMLVQLEQNHPKVVYVRTQGTLSPASDWSNELHPTEQGFNKIAGVFLNSLRQAFPERI